MWSFLSKAITTWECQQQHPLEQRKVYLSWNPMPMVQLLMAMRYRPEVISFFVWSVVHLVELQGSSMQMTLFESPVPWRACASPFHL
jgi:hypothetical protein